MRRRRTLAALLLLAQSFAGPSLAHACTGITIKPKDGSVVFARTLEFAADLRSNVIVVPRGLAFVGSTPDGKPGLRWTTKYGAVGMNAFGLPVLADGLNEKGLHVGLFYFPGYAKYQAVTAENRDQAVAPHELGGYLLETCANVDEAVEAAKNVRVGNVVVTEFGFVPPVHYVVNDAAGKSVVLEHVEGTLKVHRNPLGVMSNSPTFDWHMTNLDNYLNLRVTNVPKVDFDGTNLAPFGQGSGLLGLPGDFTPPSRFVRAVAFSKSAVPVDTARAGVVQAFHILNQFDIPKGASRGVENGQEVAEYTLWTSAADLKNLRYYFRTFEDSRIREVGLGSVNLDAKGIKTIDIGGAERIDDVSATAR